MELLERMATPEGVTGTGEERQEQIQPAGGSFAQGKLRLSQCRSVYLLAVALQAGRSQRERGRTWAGVSGPGPGPGLWVSVLKLVLGAEEG